MDDKMMLFSKEMYGYLERSMIPMGYVSFDENPEMTLDDMRKEAEKRMYKNKSDYYLKQGKDRRKT